MSKILIAGIKYFFILAVIIFSFSGLHAQTDGDAIMMTKNNFCVGAMYNYSSWKNYWEGTSKRDNANLGTVSTQMLGVMGNYGVTNNLNILFGIPYVKTKASAGTLHGLKGVQDVSLWVKWMPYEKQVGNGTLSLYTIGGFSFPATNYVADFLPLSIGLRSKNLSLRGMIDYQAGNLFATASATYIVRSKIKIDRTAYYTTQMYYSNEVAMPDASQAHLEIGYRSERMIAGASITKFTTLGGFDITKNNMPFPGNKMNETMAAINLKYNVRSVDGLSFIGGSNLTLAGRNIGQASAFDAGVFYIIDFKSNKKSSVKTSSKSM